MKKIKNNTSIDCKRKVMPKNKETFFFLILVVGMFTIGKTQNYDSIVSKIYEYNDFSEADTIEGSSKKGLVDWIRFYENRLDENGDIGAYAQNLNAYYDNNSENSGIDLHWDYIGHTNNFHHIQAMGTHGLIMKIWADPLDLNHILAGTDLNGLWETYDNGDNWICISDSEPLIKGISSLEVINDTIYIGTNSRAQIPAYYSNGLFYSSDHGDTWKKQLLVLPYDTIYPTSSWKYFVRQWIHHPVDHNTQFVLTNNFLFKSIDNGITFDTIFYKQKHGHWYNPWHKENTLYEMIVNPNNTNELFVSGPELLRVSIPEDGSIGGIIENLSDSLLINNAPDLLLFTGIGASKISPEIFWFSALDTLDVLDFIKYNDNTGVYEKYHPNNSFSTTHGLKQLEVSPFNNDLISVGDCWNNFLRLEDDELILYDHLPFSHFDIRSSKLYNEDGHLVQLIGTDGGINKIVYQDTSISQEGELMDITNDGTNGIINYDLKGFDVSSSSDNDMMLLAQAHNGVAFAKNDEDWVSLFSCVDDGTYCEFSKSSQTDGYFSGIHSNCIKYLDTETGYTKEVYEFETLDWKNKFNFIIDPDDSRILYTGEFGKLISIDCNDLNNITYSNLEFSPNILPMEYGMREGQPFIYISTNQTKSTDTVLNASDSLLYIFEDSINGLQLKKNISPVINSIHDSIIPNGSRITSIALDPFNSNRFWISFGGTKDFSKIWVTNNDGDSFTSYSNGLPNEFPVNEILFDRLAHRLYAVNDVGIFYYNTIEEEWENMTGDLPPIYSDFIRFSPDHRSLRLGSRSRGPWEASLCFYEENNPIEITSDKTWNNIMHVYSDVNIYDGATLYITDSAYISSQVHFRIHSGGKLVLNQGKLTSLCDERWQGIEVADNGELVIKNSIIENAEVAIRNYFSSFPFSNYGGIIEMLGATFVNNKKVADIRNSDNLVYFSPSPNSNHIIINDDYIGDDYPNELLSVINAILVIDDVIIENLLDENTNCVVLESMNSLTVAKSCTINNFNRGFYLTNGNLSQKITDIVFKNTRRPIYANNCNDLSIQENTLSLPTYSTISEDSYGVYLEHCTAYLIEDNLFIGDNDGEGPPEEKANIGLYINSSGAEDNMINNNTFKNIRYATVSYGQNKGEIGSGAGLCYKCNTFIDNSNDIRVLKKNQPNPGEYVPQGIAQSQGANIPQDPSSPAGNQFSYTGPTGSYTDINNKAEHFTYYYHANQPTLHLKPQYYSDHTVTIEAVFAYWNKLSCDPNGGGGGGGGDKAAENKAKADSVQNFITLIEDGGNPESLQDLVVNSLPSEAYQVYTALMAQTPELSDTTVAKAIEKEEVLGPVMIRDIMAANPKSSKNDELIVKLEERNQPLPDYMLGQILQGRSLGDFMTNLYAKRSHYTKAYHHGIEAIVSDYLSDSTLSPIAQLDSALFLLEAQNDAYFDRHILTYTVAKADYAQAQLLLNNQLSNPKLLDYQEQALEAWQIYYQILASITEEEPDSTQLVAFNELWLDNKGAASAAARSYLQTYGGLEYEEPLYIGDEMYSSGPNAHYQDLVEKAEANQYIELYPNPAKDYLIIKFDLEMEYSDAVIQISDMQGMILETQKLKASKNQILIPTKDYKEGVYTLQLSFGKQARESHKFSVIH